MENLVNRKRIKETTQRRTYLGNIDEFDNQVFYAATKKTSAEEKNITQYIMSGAWFKNEDEMDPGMSSHEMCELFCEKEEDIAHTDFGNARQFMRATVVK